ncbi:MAG: 4Fe-4S binding protein [Candidatus Bathyarchaeota archaeon]
MGLGSVIAEALRALFRRPVTVQSLTKAGQGVPVPERYRGRITFDREACIGCLLCIRTCPTGTILATEDRKVEFRLDHCIFCGQCVEICPKDAVKHTSNYEVVVSNRETLVIK